MSTKPQQPPKKHHYVPEFLLKQWRNSDGTIWRYFRNGRHEIDCKPQAPGGMGYQPGLYATEGFPPEHEQQVETLFMEPLDTAAARVHQLLLEGRVRALTNEQRSRWAGLIMSLWFRTPGDVKGIRSAVAAAYRRHLDSSAADPEGPVELPETALNQLTMDVLMRSIDNGDRGAELINMHWDVIELGASRELFVSDSPVAQLTSYAQLGTSVSYIALAISPTKLFVAAESPSLVPALRKLSQRDLVSRQNRAAVGQAEHFVGTRSRIADKFIKEHFGTVGSTSPARGLAAKYRDEPEKADDG